MKIVLLIVFVLFMAGCSSDQYPPPEAVIIVCIEKGCVPSYRTSVSDTTFDCLPVDE